MLFVVNHSHEDGEARVSPTFAYGDWTTLCGSGASRAEDVEGGDFAVSLGGKGVVVLDLGAAG